MCSWIWNWFKIDRTEDTVYHQPEDPQKVRSPGSQLGTRHLQCLMAFLAVSTMYSQRINFVTVVAAMTGKSNTESNYPVLPWDESMRGTIISAFFWGFSLLEIVAGLLAEKYGAKFFLVAVMFISGVISILTPFAAIYGGFYWMVLTRFLQGSILGCLLPPTNVLLANWVPTTEKGKLISWVFNGTRFGTVVTMVTSGILADSIFGWPAAYYLPGTLAILWAIVYCYVGSNSPRDHPTISTAEREYILNSLPNITPNRKGLSTPWKAILTSAPMWAVLVSHMSYNFVQWTLLAQIPYFINVCWGLDVKKSGYLSAVPFILGMVMATVYAEIDKILIDKKVLSRTAAKKLWNSVTLWGPAIPLSLLIFLGNNKTWMLLLLISSVVLSNAVYLGFYSNHMELSPNFAGTLMAITSTMSNIASSFSPLYVGYAVTDPKSLWQWQKVFLTIAGLPFAGNLVYLFFGTTRVQPWNFPSGELATDQCVEKEEKENIKNVPLVTIQMEQS